MNHWQRAVLVVLALVAVAAVPVQDELARRYNLDEIPTPLLSLVAVMLTALALVLGAQATPSPRSEISTVRRVNRRSLQLAQGVMQGALESPGEFHDLFGPVDSAGRPISGPSAVVGRCVLLVGPAGSGKSVALARLAKLCAEGDRPVLYSHAAELWPAGASPRPPSLRQALVSELHRRGTAASLAAQWVDDGELIVLVDGVNETVHHPETLLSLLDGFRRRHAPCSIVASLRDTGASIEGIEGFGQWHMPPLPVRRVRSQLARTPVYGKLDDSGRSLLEETCRNPLLLSMVTELGDGDLHLDASTDVDAARQLAVEGAVRRRLSWPADAAPGPEAVFSVWLARAMRSLSLGSTLELRYVVWTMLPADIRHKIRALSLIVAGAPIVAAWAVVALALDLGLPGLLASFAYMVPVFGLANLGVTRWPLLNSPRWEIVARHRWSVAQVRSLGAFGLVAIARRALWGTALGVPAGLLQWLLFTASPESVDGDGWFVWLALATAPVVLGLFGPLAGGLVAGAVASAAFGMQASLASALVGGIVVGTVAGAYFATVDLGDIRTQPTFSAASKAVSRMIWMSALQQTKFSVLTWMTFGATAGTVNWLAHDGDLQWLFQGLGAGLAGASLYGLVELMSPIGSFVIADLGLRWSGVLSSRSLDSMLIQLVRSRILVPAGSGAAFRFAHPLIGEFLETQG